MRIALPLIILLTFAAAVQGQTSDLRSGEYQPQTSIRDYFLGAWKLVSTEIKYPDGHGGPFPELGPDATGFLIYTASGYMCAQLMKPGHPAWKDVRHPTPAEAVSALDGFTSYCGKFEVHEGEKAVIHLPATAWAPNWLGTEQRRPYYLVNQDRFFFRVPSKEKQQDGSEIAASRTITWERLK